MQALDTLGLVGLGGALLAALLLWLQAWLRRLALRRRFRRAAAGQTRARALLESRGFRVTAEEATVPGELLVDGVRRRFQVRIDYLVERRGRCYGVEVKTGPRASDPLCRETRRQLAEYARLLPVDGLFLLDMDAARLMEIRFPPLPAPARGWVLAVGAGFLLGAAASVLLLLR